MTEYFCAYCWQLRPRNAVIYVPHAKKEKLEKWSRIFGPKFAAKVNFTNGISYICLQHVGMLPDDEFYVTKCCQLKEDVDGGLRVKIPNEPPSQLISPHDFCCICGKLPKKIAMRKVPNEETERYLWAEILGVDFYLNCQKFRNPQICFSHFEDADDPQALPFVLNTPEFETTQSLQYTLPKTHRCIFCKTLRNAQLMLQIPKNQDIVQLLSPKFGENLIIRAQKMHDPRICLLHIRQLLPEQKLPEISIEEFPLKCSNSVGYCCYCGERRLCCTMLNIPRIQSIRQSWYQVLGEVFRKNCEFFDEPFICLDRHFEEFPRDFRNLRPVPYDIGATFDVCRIVANFRAGIIEKEEDLRRELEERERKMKEEEEEREKRDRENQEKEEDQGIEPGPSKSTTFKLYWHKKAQEDQKGLNATCCYCGIRKLKTQMKNVPKIPKIFEMWIEVLGEDFRKQSKLFENPRICEKHFGSHWTSKWRENRIPAPQKNADIPKHLCCFCKEQIPRHLLRIYPENDKFEEWNRILQFKPEKPEKDGEKPLICIQHLENAGIDYKIRR